MNNISPFLRRCLLLLPLALMVASDSTAQGFEQRIVFASNRDGNWDIYSMDVNGNNLLQLTDHPASDQYPACSPDGMRIAFSSFRFDVGNSEIYAMDADGNNLTRLAKHEFHDVTPSWSPDGRKIAFQSQRFFAQDARTHIYVITAEGEELEQLTDGVGRNWSPVYSPDGAKIAFVSNRGGDNNIYLMDTNGRNAVKLTRTPPGISSNVSPSWLPGALAVNPNGKLPISWGKIKRTRNP